MPDLTETNLRALIARTADERDSLLRTVAVDSSATKPIRSRVDSETLLRQADELDDRIARYERRLDEIKFPKVEVRSEPLTYTKEGPHSFVKDLAHRSGGAQRLARHQVEMEIELPKLEARLARRAAKMLEERGIDPTYVRSTDSLSIPVMNESRALNTSAGTGGNFAPPLWLIEDWASVDRTGRPVANLIGSIPLPPGVQSINIPKFTAGTDVEIQVSEGSPPASSDVTDAALKSELATIAGFEDVSIQLLDQVPAPGLDGILFRDLLDAYDQDLESQVIAGSGSDGQLAGISDTSGATAVSYTSGSPTGPALHTSISQLLAQTADARKLTPGALVMRPARWFWLGGQQDLENRPLRPPAHSSSAPQDSSPAGDRFAAPDPISRVLGVPCFVSGGVPANLGTGSNQDEIFALRPQDLYLWEGVPRMQVAIEPLSSTLQVRLRLHSYAGFISTRHPAGVGVLTGTGLVVQSGY